MYIFNGYSYICHEEAWTTYTVDFKDIFAPKIVFNSLIQKNLNKKIVKLSFF